MSDQPVYAFSYEEAEADLGVDAQTAGAELDRIRRRDGHIAPAVVVAESRPKKAPLHPAFEWRDAVAAERYREHQASQLVKVVRVITPPPARQASPTTVRVERRQTSEPLVERHDPFEAQLSEVVGQMVETERRLEQIKLQAQRSFDRQRMIRVEVALSALHEAHEALLAAGEREGWADLPRAAMARGGGRRR
jgi:hypothetical protein